MVKKVISAGIIIFRRTRDGVKFLLLYHGHQYWNFPKGKLETEEHSRQAAIREVREETGLKSTELRFINFKAYEKFTFKQRKEKIFKVVILYLAETQKKNIIVSHEHGGYGWFLFKDAKQLLLRYKDNLKILENANHILKKIAMTREKQVYHKRSINVVKKK